MSNHTCSSSYIIANRPTEQRISGGKKYNREEVRSISAKRIVNQHIVSPKSLPLMLSTRPKDARIIIDKSINKQIK